MHRYLLIALVLVAGCKVGPDYRKPDYSLPKAFSTTSRADAVQNDSSVNLSEWWTVFKDPQLTALIQTAAGTNLDVRIATARVREARAQRGISSSGFYPQLTASGDYSRSQISKHSQNGKQLAAQGQHLQNNLFEAGLDMSWELDVFGGTQRAVEASDAHVGATVESMHDVMVTVLAEVGLSYLDLRGAQKQLLVAHENLRIQEDTLALTQDRFRSGLAGELDVARATSEVATTRAQIPPLEEARQRAIYRLDVLLAKNPGELESQLGVETKLPFASPRVPLGLPSDLVRQRPDIRQAERQLAEANAQIGVATSELFPKFYLTGNAGLQSPDASDFFSAGSRYWSIGPSIRWPIFTAGKIRRNIQVQNARQEQAALAYEQVVLKSLEEVQNALVTFGQEQQRHGALQDAQAASERSFKLAQDRYRAGLVDFLDVLETQRSLLANQDAKVQSERELSQNLIRLFKSLGGGWKQPQLASR